MDDRQQRTYAMLQTVRAFGDKHGPDFPRGSNATKRFEDNAAFLLKIEELAGIEPENRAGFAGFINGLNPLLKKAVANVRLLDAPIGRKYAEDKATLAAWETGSRVEFEAPPTSHAESI